MGKMSAVDCYLVARLIFGARRIRSEVSVVSVVSCVRVTRGKRKTKGEVVMVGGGTRICCEAQCE